MSGSVSGGKQKGNQSGAQSNQFDSKTNPIVDPRFNDIYSNINGQFGSEGLTPTQQGAITGLQGINNDYLKSYADKSSYTLDSLAKQYGGAYTAPQDVQAQTISADQVASKQGSEFMDAYKNPYQNDVIDASLNDLTNAYQKNQVGSNMAAAASGAFGGGRHGIRDAAVADDYLRTVAGTTANLRNQGFNTRAGLGMQDASRDLQAGGMNQNANLQASNMNASNALAADQFNNSMLNQRQMFDVNAAYQGDQQRLGAVDRMGQNYLDQAGVAGGGINQLFNQANLGRAFNGSQTSGTSSGTNSGTSSGSSKGGGLGFG